MRVNINAWCRYKEFYSLKITDEYLKQLNEYLHKEYPNIEFEDITAEDIYLIFDMSCGVYPDKFNIKLDNIYNLGSYVQEYVRKDVWEHCLDNEYINVDDYESEVEFDTDDERERFKGTNHAK